MSLFFYLNCILHTFSACVHACVCMCVRARVGVFFTAKGLSVIMAFPGLEY